MLDNAIMWWLDRWAALDERTRKVVTFTAFVILTAMAYAHGWLDLEAAA